MTSVSPNLGHLSLIQSPSCREARSHRLFMTTRCASCCRLRAATATRLKVSQDPAINALGRNSVGGHVLDQAAELDQVDWLDDVQFEAGFSACLQIAITAIPAESDEPWFAWHSSEPPCDVEPVAVGQPEVADDDVPSQQAVFHVAALFEVAEVSTSSDGWTGLCISLADELRDPRRSIWIRL